MPSVARKSFRFAALGTSVTCFPAVRVGSTAELADRESPFSGDLGSARLGGSSLSVRDGFLCSGSTRSPGVTDCQSRPGGAVGRPDGGGAAAFFTPSGHFWGCAKDGSCASCSDLPSAHGTRSTTPPQVGQSTRRRA